MMPRELPVLIVGAGPVGLSLALALTRSGVQVCVFEAEEDLSPEMRASTIHAPTLEMFEEWGVVEQVLAAGAITDRVQYWERSTRTRIAEYSFSLLADDTPYPFRLQCPQNIVTRVLRAELEQLPGCSLYFGHRAKGLKDLGDKVQLEVSSADRDISFTGSYLVGCDGSRSIVRKSLEIPLSGKTYEDRFLLVGTNIDFSEAFPGMGPVAYIYDPEEWAILLQLPTLTRTVFRVKPEEDEELITAEDSLKRRLWRLLGSEVDFRIEMSRIYRVHQRVAERFRQGRVVLAGDAAHLNNPAGGMGLNSGIHDAYLLAQTLLRIFAGEPESLLDQYSEDRRKLALGLIQSVSDRNYNDLIIADWEGRQKRNDKMRAASLDDETARQYLLDATLLRQRPAPFTHSPVSNTA
ncbi:MAG: FAD-binding protein [Rickettsiales bacterium]|nr:FAD-binding protein [Rickettsiales bacterium]